MKYFNLLIEVSSASILLFSGVYYLTNKRNKNIGLNFLGTFLLILGVHYSLLIVSRLWPGPFARFLSTIKIFSFFLNAYVPLLYLITHHYKFSRHRVDQRQLLGFFILLIPLAQAIVENTYSISIAWLSDLTSFGGALVITAFNLWQVKRSDLDKLERKFLTHINASFFLMIFIWLLVLLDRSNQWMGGDYLTALFLFTQLYLVYGLIYFSLNNPATFFNPQNQDEATTLKAISDFKPNEKKQPQVERGSTIVIKSNNQKDWIKLEIDHLLFLKSSDNYVAIAYLDSEGNQKKKLIRNTLKNLEQQDLHPLLVRCHQSYILNLARVTEIVKKKGAPFFIIDGFEDLIPISKTRQKEILSKVSAMLS